MNAMRQGFYSMVIYADYLIYIIMNINGNMLDVRENFLSNPLFFSAIPLSLLIFSLRFKNSQTRFIPFIYNHWVRLLCLSITLISRLILYGNYQLGYKLFVSIPL